MNTLDSQAIEFACPHCSRKNTQTISKLKSNPQLTCRSCSQAFTVNANELRTGIQKIEKSLADLQRALSRLGK